MSGMRSEQAKAFCEGGTAACEVCVGSCGIEESEQAAENRYTPEGDTVRVALRAWLHGKPPGAIAGVWFDDALRALLTLDDALAEQRRAA